MDSKLKSVRAGHKGAVTKLLVKFDELKSNTNTEVDEVKALDDAVTQKQKTLIDLNNSWIKHRRKIWSRKSPTQMSISHLEGSAAQTVEGFALTTGNYETAVNLLRDRYVHTSKLIHAYMKALMNLPAPTNDVFSLRFYGDKLKSYVRVLEFLGQTPEMYGSLLVPVVLDKLPIEIRKSIAREHGRDNLILENLRKSITREIDILEAGEGVIESDRLHATAFFMGTQSQSYKDKSTDTQKKVNTRTCTCIFCPDLPSNMPVAKSRTGNISQRIVQSRPHLNPLDEKLQGRKSPPRAPVIAHLHLVESRSHIDTGQEQVTYKQDNRFVKLPCVPEETKRYTLIVIS
ncbi:unnamed protein product [Mytilus coruscus]|uniref:Uncharacterized protein n=1 Tax=Mytilus coruscus TaxID=42192 RepID=A0A6J8AMC2_MYTCO|nr:unnamed protein product [Mytilus coruscus]